MNRTAHPSVCPTMTKKLPALSCVLRRPAARVLAACSLAVAAGSGCVIVDHDDPPPHDPYGDIAFDWSFEGERDCDQARVDELDIAIFQDGVLFEEIDAEPCVGGGLVLTHYFEGRYELEIDAYSRDSDLLYSGGFSIRVEGGRENDAGLVVLDAIGAPPPPPPPPEAGSVGFNWTFLYPSNNPIEACDVAGVSEVDVFLESEFGEEIRSTFDCASTAGATFDNLGEGRWTLNVDAYGRYHGGDLHLYGLTVDVDVFGDEVAELGDLALERDEQSFADVNVAWSFTGTSCNIEGIADLTIALRRDGLDDAEDVTTVDCSSLSALRRTFVPGSYTVTVTGDGDSDRFVGVSRVDVGPDTETGVNVPLAPEG